MDWGQANKQAATVLPIAAATAGGYAARKLRLLPERAAEYLMTWVMVCGYPAVGLLSIWATKLKAADIWLPALLGAHVILMVGVGLGLARIFTRDRAEAGLLAIAAALGNTGTTMGGFVVYQLYGEAGLGRVAVLGLAWMPVIVLVLYPIARHHSQQASPAPLGRLILRSVFHWRSVGLPVTAAAIALSVLGVPRPQAVADYHVLDLLIFLVMVAAYFSIGLRLHVSGIWPFRKCVAALAAMRFAGGWLVGLGLIAMTHLTGRPLTGMGRDVVMIESFVPTAVTMAAMANMFHLKPREASVLFVTNTALYMAAVLPLVFWLFG
ncbi:MAG TPA: AEC family transporter [Phycisphaerae bacterium]|nr:AEC family transporter [Phycisphaerae bacterium]